MYPRGSAANIVEEDVEVLSLRLQIAKSLADNISSQSLRPRSAAVPFISQVQDNIFTAARKG